MLKEVTKKEALAAVAAGKQVWIIDLSPDQDKGTRNLTAQIQKLTDTGPYDRYLLGSTSKEDKKSATTEKENHPAGAQPQAEPEKKKPAKQTKVDTGKIKALHDAGWTNVQIGEEMHLHPLTIGKYVRALTEEGQNED